MEVSENQEQENFVQEKIESIKRQVLVAEVMTKFAPGASLAGIDITNGQSDFSLGDFRTYRLEKDESKGWRVFREKLPYNRLPFEKDLEHIWGRVGSGNVDTPSNQDILKTLFVQVYGFDKENKTKIVSFHGGQPPREEITDHRSHSRVTPVDFTIKITDDGWRHLSDLMINDRQKTPKRIYRLLEALYPGLIGEEKHMGVVLKRSDKIVVVDKSFTSSGSSDKPAYQQPNPNRIFPPPATNRN